MTASTLMPWRLAQVQFADGFLDEARVRRNHRFGNAGAVRIEHVAEIAQARLHAQQIQVREFVDLIALAQRAEHGADPDHRVARRREARFVAVLDREHQRRAAQRFGFAEMLMPTSGLSLVTVSSNTSPAMP